MFINKNKEIGVVFIKPNGWDRARGGAVAREATGDSDSSGLREGEASGSQGDELMVRESWKGGCRGSADSQGAKYNSIPSYKNRKHKKDQRRQRLWKKPRCGMRRGRRGASTNSSRACPYCTVLGPGHGERGAPAPGTSPSTQKWKEERQGALEQTELNWTSAPVGTESRGHGSGCSLIPGEFMLTPGTARSPEGVGLSQRFVPPSSQASSTGQRRTQTEALQRAEYLHVSPKHESEPVVPRPRLLTPSRPLKVSHS